MARILITGGAGYLGSILTELFIRDWQRVTVLDTFRHGVASLSGFAGNKNLTIVRGDARDPSAIVNLLASHDIIIPLAAIVGAPACAAAKREAMTTNSDAVAMIVNEMSPDQRILFPNTNSGYGTTKGDEFCTEETPLNPISLYGTTKTQAEEFVLEHPNSVVFRFATLFGASPRMRLDLLVNEFVYRAVRDKSLCLFQPEARRNFLHVLDAARAFMHFAYLPFRQQVYNVGNSEININKRELCNVIKDIIPDFHVVEVPYAEDPDKRDYLVSNEKVEFTGFKPLVSLREGIKELISCYQQPFESSRNA